MFKDASGLLNKIVDQDASSTVSFNCSEPTLILVQMDVLIARDQV